MSTTNDPPKKGLKSSFLNRLHPIGQILANNSYVISTVCLTSVFFFAVIFWMQISSSAEQLKMLGDNYELQMKNKIQEATIEKQSYFLNQAEVIIKGQNGQMRQADEVIKKQREALENLFKRLKELEWDPDLITRSEA